MSTLVSFERFDEIYQDNVQAVYKYWTPQMQLELASHNHSWAPETFNFETYLSSSSVRFYRAYLSFAENGCKQLVCDVGGFWGVFPLTLRALGYNVTMTEAMQYYSDSFNQLFYYLTDRGVAIVDYDPFQRGMSSPGHFDIVTVMAVLEHYPHSLRNFMYNIIALLNPAGKLYIEVPNIAYWPKRMALIRGNSPLPPLEHVFKSKEPFIGHHREFTISELRRLAELSGLVIVSESFFNYSVVNSFDLKTLILRPLQSLAFLYLRDSREVIAVTCILEQDK